MEIAAAAFIGSFIGTLTGLAVGGVWMMRLCMQPPPDRHPIPPDAVPKVSIELKPGQQVWLDENGQPWVKP